VLTARHCDVCYLHPCSALSSPLHRLLTPATGVWLYCTSLTACHSESSGSENGGSLGACCSPAILYCVELLLFVSAWALVADDFFCHALLILCALPHPPLTTIGTSCPRCFDGPLDPRSPRPSGTNLQRSSETWRSCSRPRPGAMQGLLQASGCRWTVPLPPPSPPWPSHRSCRPPWLCSRPSHCTSPRRGMGEVRPCACAHSSACPFANVVCRFHWSISSAQYNPVCLHDDFT
jgi:hypothetical protein